ncbi:uncharacterized protein LOC105781506 [Gossypium raimondii]|uniref:uncharacterized protein LOC105781506 n=1 Tax=Gossypium raimondii TaxID=29730 RepID=UPI00063A8E55|nr:uncharacterized protein LOC105781506 [Gossypium raimondii]
MVTLFPNFTMSLQDPNLLDALKVQIQIIGAKMVESVVTATLHYQIVYRVQDHAFKLSHHGSEDSLLIYVNTKEESYCVHVPKQIPKQELLKFLPEMWVTNYEQINQHDHDQPIKSTKSQIITKSDETSEVRFDHGYLRPQVIPPIFLTQLMIKPFQPGSPGPESTFIESFQADGKPLYYFKDPVIGHCPWDINCSCELCHELSFDDWVAGMDNEVYKPHKKTFHKKSTQFDFYKWWINGDPNIGPLEKIMENLFILLIILQRD